MALLFLNELINFLTNKTSSRMYVDVNRGADKLKVNLDIDIDNIPCDLLAILTSDALGERSSDIKGEIINREYFELFINRNNDFRYKELRIGNRTILITDEDNDNYVYSYSLLKELMI